VDNAIRRGKRRLPSTSTLKIPKIHEQTIAVTKGMQMRKLMTFVLLSANVQENCQNVFR
jgi:hypothetical protein